jgi:hypothetical protein
MHRKFPAKYYEKKNRFLTYLKAKIATENESGMIRILDDKKSMKFMQEVVVICS